jgi:hypothetical protein
VNLEEFWPTDRDRGLSEIPICNERTESRGGSKSAMAGAKNRKGAGKKASSSTADEQATHPIEGHHPMATRHASRAGSLRGVVGSGSTGYVCDFGHPSINPGRNLFPPRRFSYHTRFSGGKGPAKLCYPASPQGVDGTSKAYGRKAVVRSSQSPRWGLTK